MKRTNNATQETKSKATNKEEKVMKQQKNSEKKNQDYSTMYEELKGATCKRDLVDTMNAYGYRTTTIPTTTPNKNDLYIQFADKSRLLITSKSLKVYTCSENAEAMADKEFYFDPVNDGSYRTKRATVSNNLENFTKIFSYFLGKGYIEALPALK